MRNRERKRGRRREKKSEDRMVFFLEFLYPKLGTEPSSVHMQIRDPFLSFRNSIGIYLEFSLDFKFELNEKSAYYSIIFLKKYCQSEII